MAPQKSFLMMSAIATLAAMPQGRGGTIREASERYGSAIEGLVDAYRPPQSTIDKPHATPTRSEAEQAEYERLMDVLKLTHPELNSKGRKKEARLRLRNWIARNS